MSLERLQMKKILTFTIFAGALSVASAQLEFTINLNGNSGSGSGTFTLAGATLQYDFTGTLSGTGTTATDAQVIWNGGGVFTTNRLFDLGAPNSTIPGFYGFAGTIPPSRLSVTEISQLLSGLWGVNVFTSSSTESNAATQTGNIVLVLPLPTPVFQSITCQNGSILFSWRAVPDLTYQVQYSSDLIEWTNLGSPVGASTNILTGSDVIIPAQNRFYRVEVYFMRTFPN